MTPRERTQAVFERRTPDRLPKEIKLTPPLLEDFRERTGADDPYEHYGLDVREVYIAQPSESFEIPSVGRRNDDEVYKQVKRKGL